MPLSNILNTVKRCNGIHDSARGFGNSSIRNVTAYSGGIADRKFMFDANAK